MSLKKLATNALARISMTIINTAITTLITILYQIEVLSGSTRFARIFLLWSADKVLCTFGFAYYSIAALIDPDKTSIMFRLILDNILWRMTRRYEPKQIR